MSIRYIPFQIWRDFSFTFGQTLKSMDNLKTIANYLKEYSILIIGFGTILSFYKLYYYYSQFDILIWNFVGIGEMFKYVLNFIPGLNSLFALFFSAIITYSISKGKLITASYKTWEFIILILILLYSAVSLLSIYFKFIIPISLTFLLNILVGGWGGYIWGIKNSPLPIRIVIVLIALFFFSIGFQYYNDAFILPQTLKHNLQARNVYVKLVNGNEVFPGKSKYYIGQTDNYLFIYDDSLKKSSAFKMTDVELLEFYSDTSFMNN